MRKVYWIAISSIILLFSCADSTEQAARDHSEKEPIKIDGKRVFLKHCAVCHGEDGRKGMAGAKVLPESNLTAEERMKIVLQGRGNMMPYKGVLSMGEIEAVVKYTLTLE